MAPSGTLWYVRGLVTPNITCLREFPLSFQYGHRPPTASSSLFPICMHFLFRSIFPISFHPQPGTWYVSTFVMHRVFHGRILILHMCTHTHTAELNCCYLQKLLCPHIDKKNTTQLLHKSLPLRISLFSRKKRNTLCVYLRVLFFSFLAFQLMMQIPRRFDSKSVKI